MSSPRGSVEVVTLQEAPGLKLLPRRTSSTFERHVHGKGATHNHGPSRSSQAIDGHVWLDPDNARVMVDRIEQALSAKEPAKTSVFKANADTLRSRLDALSAELDRALRPVSPDPAALADSDCPGMRFQFIIGFLALVQTALRCAATTIRYQPMACSPRRGTGSDRPPRAAFATSCKSRQVPCAHPRAADHGGKSTARVGAKELVSAAKDLNHEARNYPAG